MKVLITDMRHSSIEEERRLLEPAGVTLDTTFCETEEQLIRSGRDAFGFLVSYAPVTRTVMEALPQLKIIVKYGVGVDNVDLEAARVLGKTVVNVPDYCAEEVAVHGLTLLLAGLRRIYPFAEAVRRGEWESNPPCTALRRPSTLGLGILGFGRIGRRFAAYARPLASSIHYFDPFVPGPPPELQFCGRVDRLDELADRCRVLCLHAPLNEQTRNLIGPALLERARDLVLINTSRAGLVDRQALEEALDAGRVAFFGADVFWQEPPDFGDPQTLAFLRRPNVLVTPHVGWYSEDSERELRRRAAEEILRFIRGARPLHPVP